MSTILKTHDSLNRRLRNGGARPRGDRVTRQRNDLFILEAIHRFGPQTTEALYQILYPLYKDRHSLKHRLKLLRHEQETSEYGGPLIFYPSQQRRGAHLPDNNPTVYDVLPRGEKLLKNAGLWRTHHPTTSGDQWRHDFMRNTIIASIYLAAKANGVKFFYPDEILSTFQLPFAVPNYAYLRESDGKPDTRSDAKLRPDGFFALQYEDGIKRIFLVEADCHTEPLRTDERRKNHKHNILQYCALLKDLETRKPYFGHARIGVLNVFTHPGFMQSVMELHSELLGPAGSYQLYQSWTAFDLDYFRPPHPHPDLFLNSWQRVGQPPAFISISSGEQPIPSPISNDDLLAVPAALSDKV